MSIDKFIEGKHIFNELIGLTFPYVDSTFTAIIPSVFVQVAYKINTILLH